MGNELQILIIEADKDRIDAINKNLTDEIYKIETSATWDDALQKISSRNFDLVICSNRITNRDVTWFLDELVRTDPNKLNLPFIICRTSDEIRNEVERILSGKRFKWIDKESTDYVYELEWLIMGFFPRIFFVQKKTVVASIRDIRKEIPEIKKLKGLPERIERLSEEQTTIKRTYIKTENLLEMAGLMVGGVTLAIAVAVGLITILFDKKLVGIDFECPLVTLLSISALEIIFTFAVCYLTFSRRSQKIIEDRIEEIIEARRSDA